MATQPIKISGGDKTYATCTVTTAATGLSDIIDLGGAGLRSVQMSTAWTTADLTFMGSLTSSDSMQSVRTTSGATELTYTTTASYMINVDPDLFAGLRYLQLRSGGSTNAVAQAAARTVYLGLAKID